MSQFKDKLKSLRQQSGAITETEEAGSRQPLSDRLHRLRPAAATTVSNKRNIKVPEHDVAELLGGELLESGVIRIERSLPLESSHGDIRLSRLMNAPLSRLNNEQELRPESLLFMDTETTGLSGGTGTLVFLLGMARINNGTLHSCQYFLTGFKGEKALLEIASHYQKDTQSLVTFNGKCFDAPLLATRCRLASVTDPFAPLDHVDLLYPTRRAFANRWPDCRLATAEKSLLGFHRQDDLPGSEAPMVWTEFVRFGMHQRLPAVVKHNYWDLISLTALLTALAHVFDEPSNTTADVLSIARHYQHNGHTQKALRFLQQHQQALNTQGLLELAWLHRQQNQWDQALEIWTPLAQQQCLEAMEHLAKYHEHVKKDFETALRFTEQLLQHDHKHKNYLHRRNRLLDKMGVNGMSEKLKFLILYNA